MAYSRLCGCPGGYASIKLSSPHALLEVFGPNGRPARRAGRHLICLEADLT